MASRDTAHNSPSLEPGQWVKSRPVIPGYGVPDGIEGTLEWPAVAERLARAKNYWVVTASAGGVPHAVPVWGAFIDDAFYIGAGGRRTVGNLERNPRLTVHLESGDQVVIAEGIAASLGAVAPETVTAIDDQYHAKYDWRPSSETADGGIGDGWWVLRPAKVIAWTSFPGDATRWMHNEHGETPLTAGS